MQSSTVFKFPYNQTPFWQYMENYYKRAKKSEVVAELYLRNDVPPQLHNQVRDTLRSLMEEN